MLPLLTVSSSEFRRGLDTWQMRSKYLLGESSSLPPVVHLYLLLLVWFEFLTLYFNDPPCLPWVWLSSWFFLISFGLSVPVCYLLHPSVGSGYLLSSWLKPSCLSSLISCNWHLLLSFDSNLSLLVTRISLEGREQKNIHADGPEQHTSDTSLNSVTICLLSNCLLWPWNQAVWCWKDPG